MVNNEDSLHSKITRSRNINKNLIDKITAKDKLCLVAVPYNYEQGTEFGNVHETHHQPDLTKQLVLERYPQMQYLCGDDHYGYFVNYDYL